MNEAIITQEGKDRPFARVTIQKCGKRKYLVIQRKCFVDRSEGKRHWRGGVWFPLGDSNDVQSVLDIVATISALLED